MTTVNVVAVRDNGLTITTQVDSVEKAIVEVEKWVKRKGILGFSPLARAFYSEGNELVEINLHALRRNYPRRSK